MDHELDSIHAKWLEQEAGVELRAYAEGDHGVVRHLRRSGELRELLEKSLNG